MGLSTSKTKTTSSGTSNQTATTTPNLPGNLQTGLSGLVDRTNDLAGQDPYSLVPGASQLQTQAFGNASQLGSWTGGIQHAGQMADQVANAPANEAGVFGYQAPTIQNTQLPNAVASNVPTLGQAQNYSPTTYGGANVGTAPGYQALTGTAAQVGQAQTYNPTLYGGAQLGTAPQGSSQGFSAPQLAPAQGYQASLAGPVSLGGGGPSQAGAVNIGGAAQATASLAGGAAGGTLYDPGAAAQATAQQAHSTDASGLISKFYNPYQQQVIDSSMADNAQQADRVRAQQMAAGAAAGAFGGSRFGIAQAQTEGELQRARDSLGANIRSQGFNTALGAAMQQAGQDTQTSGLNAQLGTQTSQFNTGQVNDRGNLMAQLGTDLSKFNAGETNSTNRLNAQLGTQTGIANMQESGLQSRAQGDISARIGLGNAQMGNEYSIAQGGINRDLAINNSQLGSRAAEFGANANNTTNLAQGQYNYQAAAQGNDYANRFGLANLDMQGQYGLAQAGYQQQAGLQGAQQITDAARYASDTGNQFSLYNSGNDQAMRLANLAAGNSAAQFNTGLQGQYGLTQAGFQQQAGLAAADAQTQAAQYAAQTGNQFGLAQFGANADAASQYAGAQNQYGLAGYQGQLSTNQLQAQLGAQAAQFGATALNQGGQFNAGQRDNALGRQLQAASLYGDLSNNYASNARGDTMAQAQLGDMQRQIAQQQALAPYQQLGLLSDLYRGGAPLVGQTVNQNGTESSSGTQTSSMGLGSMLGGIAGSALSGWASGGFKGVSDRRAKRDIERVGTTDHGLGLYRYRYLWDEDSRPRRTGVMADEVAQLAPHAVGPVIGGYNSVNYGALGLEHLVEA